MEYLEIFKSLSLQKVKYLLCGGLAVNIYGIPRMTADIDLLIDFTTENLSRFETVVETLQYQAMLHIKINSFVSSAERRKAIEEKNLIAYSYFNNFSSTMNLNVLIDVPLKFEDMWDLTEIREAEGIEINLVSLEDLIKLKQYANRKQDNDDIILLSKLLKK